MYEPNQFGDWAVEGQASYSSTSEGDTFRWIWTSHRCPRKDVDSYVSTSCDHHPNVSKQHLQHSKKVMNQRQPSRSIRSSTKISPHHQPSPTSAFTFLGSLVSLGATAATSRFRLPGAHHQLKSFQTFWGIAINTFQIC